MEFKEKEMYLCTHDVLLKNELVFKAGNVYLCTSNGVLKGKNNKEYNLLNLNVKWEYYFKELKDKSTIEQFKEIVDKMVHLYEIKNQDYGNSFEESCNNFGIIAGLIRMADKFNRIKSLSKKENLVKDESIEDTLVDLANYSIMTLIWYKNNKNNKNKTL